MTENISHENATISRKFNQITSRWLHIRVQINSNDILTRSWNDVIGPNARFYREVWQVNYFNQTRNVGENDKESLFRTIIDRKKTIPQIGIWNKSYELWCSVNRTVSTITLSKFTFSRIVRSKLNHVFNQPTKKKFEFKTFTPISLLPCPNRTNPIH